MKLSCLLVVSGLLASTAIAQTTLNLTMDTLAANGWRTTAINVWGGSPNATVTQNEYNGTGYFRFFTGTMPVSWEFQWAGLSTDAFAGTPLSSITSVRMRNYGSFGDNALNWQPPTFTWIVDKGDSNQRCITWQPWSNGNARQPGVWHEYDAATTGRWLVEETGIYYNSLAALQAALPNAYFEYTAQLPTDWGYASQHAFNVGNCPLYDEDRAWFSGAAGYIDWFEVGVNGNVTTYALGLVPEPTTMALLAAGLLLAGLQRRKQR